MMWFKKHWKKILLLLIAVGLVGLFLWGESMQSYDQRVEQTAAPEHTELPVSEESKQPEAPASSEMPDGVTPAPTGTDGADPALPEETPMQTVPQGTEQEENAYTCTISISCAVLLEHMEELSPEKAENCPAGCTASTTGFRITAAADICCSREMWSNGCIPAI